MRWRPLSKVAFAIGVTAASAYSTTWTHGAFGNGPLFALMANWIAMSWIALTGQVVSVRMPKGFHRFRAFERDGTVYERLGIRVFKRSVRRGPLALLTPSLRLPTERTAAALMRLDGQMRRAEAGHAVVCATVCTGAVVSVLAGWVWTAAWLMLFNVPFNCYPVILQRYNRLKLQEASAGRGDVTTGD